MQFPEKGTPSGAFGGKPDVQQQYAAKGGPASLMHDKGKQWQSGPKGDPKGGPSWRYPGGPQPPQVKIWDPVADLREKRKERRRQRRAADKENGVIALMVLGVVTTFLWALPIVGGSWHSKEFNGFGAQYFEVDTGLLNIDVDITCGKNFVEDQICELIGRLKGRHSLRTAVDLTCALGEGASLSGNTEACYMMRQLFYASAGPLLAFTLTMVFYALAIGFLYYYWYVEPLKRTRRLAQLWFVLAPVCGFTGFILWTSIAPDIGQFPKAMLGTAVNIPRVGSNVFGEEIDSLPYGWCWFMCIFAGLFSIATVCVWRSFFHVHVGEKALEEQRERDLFNHAFGTPRAS